MQIRKMATARCSILVSLTTTIVSLSAFVAPAQFNPVWYDGYGVSGGSSDANHEYTIRQSGVLAPIIYAQSPAAGDWRHQVLPGAGGVMQLAADGPTVATQLGLVSPNYNFNGLVGGEVPSRVSVRMNLDVQGNGGYNWAAVSLGSSAPLTHMEAATPHFGVNFVEDGAFGNGNYIQFFDGNTLVGNLIPFAVGGGGMFDVALTFSDLSDSNPWNGVGSTTIALSINGLPVASYTKGGGGYTDNFLTLEGGFRATGPGAFALGITHFDDLTVYTTPVPEPSTLALLGLGVSGLLISRRRRA